MSSQTNDEFVSKLDKNAQRFLAHVVVHGLTIGRRTAVDFIRHFSPSTIMKGLDARPHLRADILEITTGLNRKVALKKSAGSAGEDVQIALEEGVTSAEAIVRVFHPDDRVRHLDNKKLWSYAIEGDFWATEPSNRSEFERSKEHVAFILDRALIDRLITHEDLIEGVSVEKLAECLPRAQLAQIIRAALELGKNKKPFSEEELLRASAARVIVEDVSLRHIWETVVTTKIARAHGLEDEPRSAAAAAKESRPAEVKTEAKVETAKPAETKPAEAKAEAKTDAKAETKVETKPETKSDAKAETKVETKPETKPDAKAETKPETKSDAKVETKTETKSDAKDAGSNGNGNGNGNGKATTASKPAVNVAKITAPGKQANNGGAQAGKNGGELAKAKIPVVEDPPTQEEEIEVLHVDDDDFDDFPPEPTDVGVRVLPRE